MDENKYFAESKSLLKSLENQEQAKLVDMVNNLLIKNQTMWELVKEKTGLTDEDFMKKLKDIDMRDGLLNGKINVSLLNCSSCGKINNSTRDNCIYCGGELENSFVFGPTNLIK